jgi:ribosomal protein L40E
MAFCPFCGAKLGEGWLHCSSCGKKLAEVSGVSPAIQSPHPTSTVNASPPGPIQANPAIPVSTNPKVVYSVPEKERGTAVVLAILLGYWTWIYTYKVDAAKFWTAMIGGIAVSIIVFTSAGPVTSSGNYTHPEYLGWSFAAGLVIYILAIAHAASRDYKVLNAYYAIHGTPKAMPVQPTSQETADGKICPNCNFVNPRRSQSCFSCGEDFVLTKSTLPKNDF